MLGISSACSRPWLMPMHQPTCDMRICHGEGELRTPRTAVKHWRTSNSAAPDTSGTLPGSFCVTMDNCLNTIELAPGWDGKNAVLMGWFDAIKFHDEKVVIVEQRMDVVDAKKKIFLEKQRIFEVGGKDMDGSARCVGAYFQPPAAAPTEPQPGLERAERGPGRVHHVLQQVEAGVHSGTAHGVGADSLWVRLQSLSRWFGSFRSLT